MVASLDITYALTHGLDHTGCFMPENTWEKTFGILSRQRVCICMAKRGGNDFDANFSRSRRGDGHVCHFQWLVGLPCYRCLANDRLAHRFLHGIMPVQLQPGVRHMQVMVIGAFQGFKAHAAWTARKKQDNAASEPASRRAS